MQPVRIQFLDVSSQLGSWLGVRIGSVGGSPSHSRVGSALRSTFLSGFILTFFCIVSDLSFVIGATARQAILFPPSPYQFRSGRRPRILKHNPRAHVEPSARSSIQSKPCPLSLPTLRSYYLSASTTSLATNLNIRRTIRRERHTCLRSLFYRDSLPRGTTPYRRFLAPILDRSGRMASSRSVAGLPTFSVCVLRCASRVA